MAEDWTIKGDFVECCNCSVPCQCLWHEAPDDNICDAGVFWHIEEGNYGNVSLDGLTGGVLVDQEGVLFEGGWKVVLVLDEAADEDQAEALQMIFSGEAGGLFGALSGMIDEVVDVVSLPIEFTSTDDHVEYEVGDVISVDVDGSEGLHGQQGTVFPHPLIGDQDAKIGKTNEYIVDFNEEFAWDFGGNNSYFGEYELASG